MNYMRQSKSIRALVFLALNSIGIFGLSSCAEPTSGGGSATPIPQIVVSCTSAACNTNATPNVYVLITNYNCDPGSDGYATASSSLVMNCTVGGGCYGTTSAWVNSTGSVSKIPGSTYTICGRIDFNNNFPAGITNDDTTSVKLNVNISSSSSGPVNLTTWTDP